MTRLIRQTMICAAFLMPQQGVASAQSHGRPAGSNEAQITVNLTIPFVSDERDPLKLAVAQSQFRKTLYEIAARECVSLVETIADECRMVSMNVNANNQMPMMMATMMNANAQYRVILKAR